jgi:hypothetical protein
MKCKRKRKTILKIKKISLLTTKAKFLRSRASLLKEKAHQRKKPKHFKRAAKNPPVDRKSQSPLKKFLKESKQDSKPKMREIQEKGAHQ